MTDIPFLFDPGPVAWLQQLLGPGWPTPWRVVSLLGVNWGILLVVGLGLWLWGRRAAYAILAVVVVEGLLKNVLNQLVFVARPEATGLIKYEQLDVASFPSGHVSTTAALWGWLAYRSRISWMLAITVILLMALSRLYLGVHFIGDILGGLLLAVVVVGLVSLLWPPVRDWLGRRSFAFLAVIAGLALAGVVAGAFLYFGARPYLWRGGGLVAGLAIGLPLEYRYIRYRPGRIGAGRKAVQILVGAAGIAVFAAIDELSGARSFSLGFTVTALAALWTVLVAPTLFASLGWSEPGEPRRRDLVRRTARGLAIGAGVLVLVALYGIAVEPRLILDTTEEDVTLPHLPPAWEGRTVAAVSDFQVGLWLDNTGMMRRAIQEIVDRQPAAVLLAGDFLYDAGRRPETEAGHVMAILRPLVASGIPAFAVLGNHDWGVATPSESANPNREAAGVIRDSLEAARITVLHNRAATIPAPGGGDPLYVVGVGSKWMDSSGPAEAVDAVPDDAPRIVLMHHPRSFPQLPGGTAPLAVAGHTHGGQVRIPFTPQWTWLTFTASEDVHADGWIEDEYGRPGNRLYVTRGIGMSVVPLRINCPPEVVFFTLRRGNAPAASSPS